jgi:hypothetical protein
MVFLQVGAQSKLTATISTLFGGYGSLTHNFAYHEHVKQNGLSQRHPGVPHVGAAFPTGGDEIR